MRYGHRQTLEPSQVKSSTGLNREAWPLRVNSLREDRTGPEEWRAVVGYEGLYEVSRSGLIRSLHGQWAGLTLKPDLDRDGYLRMSLSRGAKRNRYRVHRIVAAAFHSGKQNALHNEVAHLDGNRANCCAGNLKWVSKVENHSHKRLHGTHQAGARHPRAKLSPDAVTRIRTRYAAAATIARDYGVSRHAVYDIWEGVRWKASIRGKV